MNDDTSYLVPKQLEMFADFFPDKLFLTDNRPLPEIIADENNFDLAFQDVNDDRLYAVQDWIKGVARLADNKAAGNFWRAMKRRVSQLSTWCTQLPYTASNGKTYQTDHASAETLYAITQRMDVNTGLRDVVLAYLAKSGVTLDEWRIEPDKGVAQLTDYASRKEYAQLVAEGFTHSEAIQWIDNRDKQKQQRPTITDEWKVRGAVGRDYADLTNTVTSEAVGKSATQLKRELQVKNVRDHLSAAENAAIAGVELFSSMLHNSRDSQGVVQLTDDIQDGGTMIDKGAILKAFSKRRPS